MAHEELFLYRDAGSEVEIVTWRARASCRLPRPDAIRVADGGQAGFKSMHRKASFAGVGIVDTPVLHVESMLPSQIVTGPAIIESSFTSVVVDPGAMAERMASGSLLIRLNPTELS